MTASTPSNAKNILKVSRISSVNCFDLAPRFTTMTETHSTWEFIYVDSGEVRHSSEGESRILRQGEIIFRRPEEPHSTVCNGKKGAVIFNIIFDCRSKAMRFFAGRSMRVPPELTPLLKRLIEESSKTFYVSKQPLTLREDALPGGEQLVRLYVEELLLLLMRTAAPRSDSTAPPLPEKADADSLTEEICRYLVQNVRGRVTLAMLCERFHFGKSYLSQHFKRNTGVSILNYYIDLKITEAKKMLREDSLAVHRIAEQLGFESPEYFSRCFRKRTGYSPQAFRSMLITNARKRDH